MAHMISKRARDPIGILIVASLVRDDYPWLYELGLDAYRAAKGRSAENMRDALRIFRDAAEATIGEPFMREMVFMDKETQMVMRELPAIINHFMDTIPSKVARKRPI